MKNIIFSNAMFVFVTALLLSGFPNLMTNEVFATSSSPIILPIILPILPIPVITIISEPPSVITKSNGNGCDDCTPPTLGIDSKGTRLVDNGFTYNGNPTNVERFFTPYLLITVNIGEPNTAVFKIYEDTDHENIKHFSFAFGLASNEIISQSKAMIELDIDHEGTETVTVTDPHNALQNVLVSTDVDNCNGTDDSLQCLIVTIHHTFRAPLDFNIVATDVWDEKRNAWQNYYNHGIEITGESLNPPEQHSGINKGHIYHLTETSSTTAVDEFGGMWSFTHDTWSKDYIKTERVKDSPWLSMNRMHSDFYKIQDYEIKRATKKLLELCPECIEPTQQKGSKS